MGIRQRVAAQKYIYAGSALLGIAFIIAGIQHFIYIKFVATLVPAYMPIPIFWAGFVGAAMILAGISFLLRRNTTLTALLLSVMMAGFIVMIHGPKLAATPKDINTWLRALQDVAILGIALMLTSKKALNKAGIYLYTLPLIVLGAAHFLHPAVTTAKIPAYFPATRICDIVIGVIIVALAICIVARRYAQIAALALGSVLLIFALLYSGPLLAANINNGGEWTNFLISLAIASGGFVAAGKSPL